MKSKVWDSEVFCLSESYMFPPSPCFSYSLTFGRKRRLNTIADNPCIPLAACSSVMATKPSQILLKSPTVIAAASGLKKSSSSSMDPKRPSILYKASAILRKC
jgi:hypothetical protein